MHSSVKWILLPWLLCLLAVLLFTQCTRPLESDLKGNGQGLADDELVWILHLVREAETGATVTDSVAIVQYNAPIFEQVLPQLLSDLQEGKLAAYDNFETEGEERPIEDLELRLAELGASWQDVSVFVQVCEVYARGRTEFGRFRSRPEYLRLLWQDPEGVRPDRSFVNLKLEDLAQKKYALQVRGEEVDFVKHLSQGDLVAYPVYVRSNKVDYRIRSRVESDYLKRKIEEGDWPEVKWGDEGINVAGKDAISLDLSTLRRYTGTFEFSIPPEDTLSTDTLHPYLYLTVAPRGLVADWSERLNVETIFPWEEGKFFTYDAEFYDFLDAENQIQVVKGKDTLLGTRLIEAVP